MTHPRFTVLSIASVLALLLNAALNPGTPTTAAPEEVVAFAGDGVDLIDPVTGQTWWSVGNGGTTTAAVTSAGGFGYASVSAPDGRGTDVYAVSLADNSRELIGRVPGRALVSALASTGDQLYLLTFPDALPMVSPVGVSSLTLPDRWRGAPSPPAARRDVGGGILSHDGRRWYRLQLLPDARRSGRVELEMQTFRDGEQPIPARLELPITAWNSLVLTPDGRTLYAIDHGGAEPRVVHVIDAERLALVRSVELPRTGAKGRPCAASLSPSGDRLYAVVVSGIPGDKGIDVYDTVSWRRIAHHVPERSFWCLAVSPDGRRLYASTPHARELVTLDVEAGTEPRWVSLDVADELAYLVAAASAP